MIRERFQNFIVRQNEWGLISLGFDKVKEKCTNLFSFDCVMIFRTDLSLTLPQQPQKWWAHDKQIRWSDNDIDDDLLARVNFSFSIFSDESFT